MLRLTLNRPEKRNALNAELCRDLAEAPREADYDPAVGAILLSANGKSFCAGMDLDEVDARLLKRSTTPRSALHHRRAARKPLVAAVQGAALGGGTGLVANCHIVIASEDATFGLTEIRLGLWPFLVFRAVAAAVGERRTVELALTGRIFDAGEAGRSGWSTKSCRRPGARAAEVAEPLPPSAPPPSAAASMFVQETRGTDWRTAGEIARRVRNEVFQSRRFPGGDPGFPGETAAQWPSLDRVRNLAS